MKFIKKTIIALVIAAMIAAFPIGENSKAQAKFVYNPYLNYSSINILKGHTFKIKMMHPNGKVKWKTSNKKIATVKNGKVKGVGVGKCKVYAQIKKKKYVCKVKVKRNPNEQASDFKKISQDMVNLKLDLKRIEYNSDATLKYSTKANTFKLKVFNTKKKVTWKSSNKKIATVNNTGLVTAKKKGTCKIFATVGKTKTSCSVNVTNLADKKKIEKQQIIYTLVQFINDDRIKVKSRPLKVLEKLNEIAEIRVKEVAQKSPDKLSHTRPNGKSYDTVYDEVGFKKGIYVGENVGYTADKPEYVGDFVKDAYKYWYKSKLHRQNMLDKNFQCIGIGYWDAGDFIGDFGERMVQSYWTQELYKK